MAAPPTLPGVDFNNIDWDLQEKEDEAAMLKMTTGDGNLNFEDSGLEADVFKKNDDAEDYEDISDDDLPEEEEATQTNDVPELTDDAGTSNDIDDLFGEDGMDFELGGDDAPPAEEELEEDLFSLNFPGARDAANQDPNIPSVVENGLELCKQVWPGFDKGIALNFNDLLPPKKAHYVFKSPVKPPKPFNPTKVSLEIAPDQEKAFRSATSTQTAKRKRGLETESNGVITIYQDHGQEETVVEDFDWTPAEDLEAVGGFTFADLEVICADWENINPSQEVAIVEDPKDDMDDWDRDILGYSSKRLKTSHKEVDFVKIPHFDVPTFDDFENDTKRIAIRVVLDFNDPYLLVDTQTQEPAAKRQRTGADGLSKRNVKSGLSAGLNMRFNYSNDDAYELLKENHQNRIRATIGNPAVEHTMPAQRLQWPYFLTRLDLKGARAFHRPALKFKTMMNQKILFAKPLVATKRKLIKNKTVEQIFDNCESLSLRDHYSVATLLEYSEEHPTVLSNFGMGNRIINYYRRKHPEDENRPTPDDKVGDLQVLLPEDKSPFSNFGMVDPGETVRAVHNAMYRAPIFQHDPQGTDFLVVRTSTGIAGHQFYLRNINHLYTVGQQFPSVEVPGPHSRKVTNAAKNRMKMLAYRKIRRNPNQHLKIQEITKHILDSTDVQNRQKLKEFINYDKNEKVWKMKPGETVPEPSAIRAMVKPEDVCLIDAMQVGARHLEDSGYDANGDAEELEGAAVGDVADKPEDQKGPEHDLAPWRTSKAFLEASADKAMLELFGPGDPTGKGLGFSFIKTSMKGGFGGGFGPSATSAAAMEAERKANGGHTYNVKKQQKEYNDKIREIWDKQKANLSDPHRIPQNEMELEPDEDEEKPDRDHMSFPSDKFDDSASQFSVGEGRRKTMRIIRTVNTGFGPEERTELIHDPRIWKEYQRRRALKQNENTDVFNTKPTGDPELDRLQKIAAIKELERLKRNKKRREGRESQKKGRSAPETPANAGSPSATTAATPTATTGGTVRKCANCGMVGHIKTNKKYCPNCE